MSKRVDPIEMTKRDVLQCLNEIGYRFVKAGVEDDVTHFKQLGLAFGVAYFYVQSLPADAVEQMLDILQRKGLEGGSTQ